MKYILIGKGGKLGWITEQPLCFNLQYLFYHKSHGQKWCQMLSFLPIILLYHLWMSWCVMGTVPGDENISILSMYINISFDTGMILGSYIVLFCHCLVISPNICIPLTGLTQCLYCPCCKLVLLILEIKGFTAVTTTLE